MEDRSISALNPVNALIDGKKLWKPVFASVWRLRAVRVHPSRRLRIFKRDARHFFHHLGIGRRWEKLLAHPPI